MYVSPGLSTFATIKFSVELTQKLAFNSLVPDCKLPEIVIFSQSNLEGYQIASNQFK
ncbi:MAG: hypothetical protein Q8S84_08730 [bacterium]|nr:hypothetical protein [bacterium]MDP3381513.1 hypothetical protein [bacterium]